MGLKNSFEGYNLVISVVYVTAFVSHAITNGSDDSKVFSNKVEHCIAVLILETYGLLLISTRYLKYFENGCGNAA